MCRKLKIQSMAFPGLGADVGGISPEEAASTMLNALKEHIDKGTTLREAVFVGFSEDLAEAFQKAVERILS